MQSGDVIGRFRRGLGAGRPAGAHAGRGRRPPTASRTIRARRFRRCAAGKRFHRQGAARGPAGRPGHLLPRPLPGSRVADHRRRAAIGRFRTAPADRRSVSFVWSGDTAGQGWGIDEARGGMRTYATMRNNRPDFFIHCGDTIYADGPIAAEVKLPDGTLWKNLVTEDKSKPAETLARVPRQLQIQPARRESARLQRRSPDVRAMGRPRGHQQLVAGRAADARRASAQEVRRQEHAACWRARGPRVPRIHAAARRRRPSPAASTARFPTARCSTCSCSTCAAIAGRTARTCEASYGPACVFPRAAADRLAQARADELARDLEGDRRRHADRLDRLQDFDRKWGIEAIAQGDGAAARPRARDRRPAVVHQARRRPQHRLAHGRRALHRGALLRPEPGGVPGLRAVLGVRLRPDPCRHLRPQTSSTTRSARSSCT